jgi:hypothetical protein
MSRNNRNTSAPVEAPTASIPAESIAITQNDTPPAITPQAAIACLVECYGITSASLLERAIKAAMMAANANALHGDMRAKMPIIQEVLKDGKATKREGVFSVRDTEGVTRDASKLTPEQRKAYNALVVTITAAKHLGILAAKVR